jgi:lipid II:glycine glycyltransferase (peptidoglycan interpeptide bridge formation enzyme)
MGPVAAIAVADADAPNQPTGSADLARLRTDPMAWDAFVASTPSGSFPQQSAWAEANAGRAWRSTRVVVEAPGGPIGAQVLMHRMRPGPWSRAYAPRGPVAATLDAMSIAAFSAAVRELAKRERLSHVLIDPEIDRGAGLEAQLTEHGWREAGEIQINRTRVVDLGRDESDLWSDLRSSARWSVNRARRSGITVSDEGETGLADFERLYRETARRVGFAPEAAFQGVFTAFAKRGAARLLIARSSDGSPYATLMLIDCGSRVIEYYGASSAEGAQARANYLIKWEAINTSRERGMTLYDMWGTDVPGLAEFKQAFGGRDRTYVGAWELVTNRPAYLSLRGVRLCRGALDRVGVRAR